MIAAICFTGCTTNVTEAEYVSDKQLGVQSVAFIPAGINKVPFNAPRHATTGANIGPATAAARKTTTSHSTTANGPRREQGAIR